MDNRSYLEVLHGQAREIRNRNLIFVGTTWSLTRCDPSQLRHGVRVEQALPRGVGELTPLQALRNAVSDHKVGFRKDMRVELLLVQGVRPDRRDVRAAPQVLSPQQRGGRGRDDQVAQGPDIAGF